MGVAKKRRTPRRRAMPKLKRLSALSRRDVTRQEYNHVVDLLNRRGEIIAGIQRELETQFKRIAQIQSELDEVRRGWLKMRGD